MMCPVCGHQLVSGRPLSIWAGRVKFNDCPVCGYSEIERGGKSVG